MVETTGDGIVIEHMDTLDSYTSERVFFLFGKSDVTGVRNQLLCPCEEFEVSERVKGVSSPIGFIDEFHEVVHRKQPRSR